VIANPAPHKVADSATGFLNICEMLTYTTSVRPYPRGFPYSVRHKEETWQIKSQQADVAINAGLWLLDPDVDAITWLVSPLQVKEFSGHSLVLGRNSWAPINTQNTALRRDVIPAYYYIRMGYPISGNTTIDRYGDIFSGYFAQACAKHLGGAVRFGTPMVEHRRNSHSYMKDAGREWACIELSEDLLPWLHDVKIEGKSYLEAYLSLSYLLEDVVERFTGAIWTDPARGYFHQVAYHMRAWLNACRTILGCR
jgi:Reversibly glycosylated polypeptide